MKALDLYTERQARDSLSDRETSRTLFRDASSMPILAATLPSYQQMQQDRITFATCSLLLGSPFMIFGLGAQILDEVSSVSLFNKIKPEAGTNPHLNSLETQYPDEITSFINKDIPSTNQDLRAWSVLSNTRRPLRPTLVPQPGLKWLPGPFYWRCWKVDALLKNKERLLSQLEKAHGQLNFLLSCQLRSSVDFLDKQIKRLIH